MRLFRQALVSVSTPPVALVALAGAVLFAAPSPLAAADNTAPAYVVKLATVAPEGTTWMKIMRQADEEIRRETGNAVGFKIYPGGVQGDELVVLRKIRSKQLQGGAFTGLGLGTIASDVRVLELPFLLRSYEQVDRVEEKVGAELEAALKKGGFTTLGWVDVGFVYLFSRKPIATMADIRAAKMWLWEGDPLAEAFFRSAGVVPVPLPVTDVMTSLQTKMVDGVYSPSLACLALQWYTRVSHYTDLPVTYSTAAVVITNEAFEGIPAQHRETVMKICRARFRDLVVRTRQEEKDALVQIEKSGVKRVPVAAAETQQFETIGRSVWQQMVGKLYPQSLLDQVVSAAGTAAPAAPASR